MLRLLRHLRIPPCARGLTTWGRRFFPASSRRRRRSAPFTRPKLTSGGRSSRPRISRENRSGSRLAFQGSNMMKLPRRYFLHLAACAAALPAVSRFAWAQAYPTRPVHLIEGFGAGGAPDIVARLIAQSLSERLGQSFVVENRGGASSSIATEAVVRASPDGYTLLLITTANPINTTMFKLNFDFIRDITPVATICRVPLVMEVHPSVTAKTVEEFIAYAKANPGKINLASAGIGSLPHMAGEMFKMMAGIDLFHVPYRGAQVFPALLAGEVQVYFGPLLSSIGYIRAGNLRPLAVTTTTRSQILPD